MATSLLFLTVDAVLTDLRRTAHLKDDKGAQHIKLVRHALQKMFLSKTAPTDKDIENGDGLFKELEAGDIPLDYLGVRTLLLLKFPEADYSPSVLAFMVLCSFDLLCLPRSVFEDRQSHATHCKLGGRADSA